MAASEHELKTTLSIDEINLGDPDFWLRDDVDGALAMLRESRPISWHQHPAAGKGFWAFVDYEDIAEVNRDWETFSNKNGTKVYHDADSDRVRPGTGALIELDPPVHTVNRSRVHRAFTPRQVRKLEGYVRDQARRLVSQFSVGEEIDFIDDLAAVLPIEIVGDLMGVDREDRKYILDLTNVARADHEPDVAPTPEHVTRAVLALRGYGMELAARRLADPKEDLISEIAQFRIDGEPLPKEEIAGYFGLVVSAGSGTTRAALAHGMLAFTEFPEQRRLFVADPVGLEGTMAEEVIRWATPIKSMGRVVQHDTTFKGIEMREGEKVAMWYMAPNRDPRLFPKPFEFDITRDGTAHQSFGGGGPHFCLGAGLARREVYLLFQELFARFPNAEVVGEPVKERSLQTNSFKSMRVRLSA